MQEEGGLPHLDSASSSHLLPRIERKWEMVRRIKNGDMMIKLIFFGESVSFSFPYKEYENYNGSEM